MEIVQYFRTVAEFADYSLDLLYTELANLLGQINGNVPTWFFTCCTLSIAVGLMHKVWR